MATHTPVAQQSETDLRVRLAVLEQQTKHLYFKDFLDRADHQALDDWGLEKSFILRELAARYSQEQAA